MWWRLSSDFGHGFLTLVAPLATLAEYNPQVQEEGETEAKVAAAVLQFKEKSTGVREPLPHAWRNQVGFRRVTLEERVQKTFETEVL